MQTVGPRQRRPQALRALLASPPAQQQFLDAAVLLPEDVARYLGQLALLYDLPFDTLVPDARMLPPESIRFFFIDQNWLDALRDGALSVADLTSQDRVTLDLLRPAANASADRFRHTERLRRRGRSAASQPPGGGDIEQEPWTGFLLRSSLAADWPGLHVSAFRDQDGTQPLDLKRLDRVAPSVLLAIAAGRAQQIRIAKPPQGLHYGAIHDDGDPGTYRVYLRALGCRFPAGPQLPGDPSVAVPMRNSRMVIDIAALHRELAEGINAAYAPDQAPPVDPAAFGLEVIAGAVVQVFVPDPGPVLPVPLPLPRQPGDA
jgi:hypothetical protein